MLSLFSQTNADIGAKLAALDRSQAIIEFDLDGTIRTANENFLATVGYRLDEIQGKHHRMFVDPSYAASREYQQFWMELAGGTYQAAEYKRFGKGGKEVWIQASYNPILDMNGQPFKVVKYATDITERIRQQERLKLLLNQISGHADTLASSAEELTAVKRGHAGRRPSWVRQGTGAHWP